MALALIVLIFASAARAADFWVAAGIEREQRVALNLVDPVVRRDASFTAVLAMIPLKWPTNNYAYTVWIAEFDCGARTRTMKFRIAYSSRRDPIRTELTVGSADTDQNAAVATQLDILCGEIDPRRLRTFNHLGEFAIAHQR